MVIILTMIAMGTLFSVAAFFLGVYCLIKIKAAEQSKFEFIQANSEGPVNPSDLFETDMDKINQQLEDDELDEEITNTFEEDTDEIKPLNEVII